VQTPPTLGPELVPVPAVPGIEETDWVTLAPEDQTKLAPILKKVERGVSAKLQETTDWKRKAAAWDSAMSIPAVNDALQRYLEGRNASPASPPPKDETESLSFEDLDAGKVRSIVTQTVKEALAESVGPLQQQLAGLFEVVARREMDSQFLGLREKLPGIEEHRAEITQLIAEDKARSVEDAYDLIQGRLARTRKPKLPQMPSPTPAQEAAATVVSPEAGPLPGHLQPAKSRGMLEHLRAALREHQVIIR
jgi:hypothetical protein